MLIPELAFGVDLARAEIRQRFYSDPNDGTATLTVWDNNHANTQEDYRLDFRGDELIVSVSGSECPLKGIFLFLITQRPLGVDCRNWSSCPSSVVASRLRRALESAQPRF